MQAVCLCRAACLHVRQRVYVLSRDFHVSGRVSVCQAGMSMRRAARPCVRQGVCVLGKDMSGNMSICQGCVGQDVRVSGRMSVCRALCPCVRRSPAAPGGQSTAVGAEAVGGSRAESPRGLVSPQPWERWNCKPGAQGGSAGTPRTRPRSRPLRPR